MKLFKHRGAIYVSKTGYKSSLEERILLILLAIIIAVTVVFFIIMGKNYSSFADFIAGDDVTVTQDAMIEDDFVMPNISGKTNFLIMETDKEQSVIHYAYIIQMDCDNKAYKVSTLSPNMRINNQSLYDLYYSGGGAMIQTELMGHLGIDIDYYAVICKDDFVEFLNKMGSFVYPSARSIKFIGGEDEESYSVRIKEGEQKLSGNDVCNLVRYYSTDGKDLTASNEVVLYALTQLFNAENFEKCDSLFRLFVTSADTNITVRNFENAKDAIMVFCKKNNDITVYSCPVEYKSNSITNESITDIKGYFSK